MLRVTQHLMGLRALETDSGWPLLYMQRDTCRVFPVRLSKPQQKDLDKGRSKFYVKKLERGKIQVKNNFGVK